MSVLTRKRSLAILAVGAIVVSAVIATGSLRAGTECSIAWLSNDFGLDRSSSSTLSATEEQTLTTEAHKQFPSATIEETEKAAIKSSRMPPVDGHQAFLVRLGNLPPEGVGGPAGQQLPSLDVFCAMSVYDSNSGAFLVTLKAFGDDANSPPTN